MLQNCRKKLMFAHLSNRERRTILRLEMVPCFVRSWVGLGMRSEAGSEAGSSGDLQGSPEVFPRVRWRFLIRFGGISFLFKHIWCSRGSP